jgi:hypothetical protein
MFVPMPISFVVEICQIDIDRSELITFREKQLVQHNSPIRQNIYVEEVVMRAPPDAADRAVMRPEPRDLCSLWHNFRVCARKNRANSAKRGQCCVC